ncbi:RING-H2 finger protein ATL29-like [Nicotiana sylvestris]|uniref:RING-type E3 ubiquitin transferase n=2 Tax=Nicotiana TaxID=4085 RepID=A0A1S3ZK08_TOBAC|nr:PREDICTED: RING-H2 finger protein ATL29-like [Nicotiana sylvestris]XP_016464706.1 PREDICTED: RING-H2 finger protein ATL29-like [Nicotiana tabacum]
MSTSSIQNSPPPPLTYSSPPLAIIIAFIIFVFLFIALFSIFFCRCFLQNVLYSWHITLAGIPICPTKNIQGLDPLIIQSFPTFIYSSVQDYGEGKYGIECAICLVEFVDDSFLRLLTSCNHVFHQGCIDHWLELHKTCPVCRASLDSKEMQQRAVQSTKLPQHMRSRKVSNCIEPMSNSMHGTYNEEELLEHTCSITIKDDDNNNSNNNNNKDDDDEKGLNISGKFEKLASETLERIELRENAEKFSRSQSTGHSIILVRESEDRFTLGLPEHVRAKIMKGHNLMRSCTSFEEFKNKTTTGNCCFGEISELSIVSVDKI